MRKRRRLRLLCRCLALAAAAGVAAPGCEERGGDAPAPAAPATFELVGPGGATAVVETDAWRLSLRDAAGSVRVEERPGGLRFDGPGGRFALGRASTAARRAGALDLDVETRAGPARVSLSWAGEGVLELALEAPAGTAVTHFCERFALAEDEAVYGLTERVADGTSLFGGPPMNEIVPREEGSLDRRGQRVEMYVRPTTALYAPLYHSSRGYGHLVEGTLPGVYDVGASDAEALDLCFEAERGASARGFRTVFFLGDPREIADAYTARTGRPFAPPPWAFRHWRWRDEHEVGPPAWLDGSLVNAQVAEDLIWYDRLGIPAGVYLIDRPWSEGSFGFESFRWDEERFPNVAAMRASLATRGFELALWTSGFAVGENARIASERGFLAPGSDLVLDLTHPGARAWWRREHEAFARQWDVAAWKLDRGEEFLPSDRDDIWADGRDGRAVHNDYPRLQAELVADVMREVRGSDFAVLVRAGYTGAQRHAIAWGGDITGSHFLGYGPGTDLGLRSALIALLRAGFLGYPFWGSDVGGYYEFGDRDVFARWLEFGAFTAIMNIGGGGDHAPWAMPTEPHHDEEMIEIYRRYVRLHHDLVPYFVAHARGEGRRGVPLSRALVWDHPADPRVRDLWDEFLVGADLLVAPVWRAGQRARDVYLPAGEWEDFWDASRRFRGPADVRVDVPLDHIPVFVRAGADVPGRSRRP